LDKASEAEKPARQSLYELAHKAHIAAGAEYIAEQEQLVKNEKIEAVTGSSTVTTTKESKGVVGYLKGIGKAFL
jgi:UDP-N-acetylmuramyl pentapeptide synthase